ESEPTPKQNGPARFCRSPRIGWSRSRCRRRRSRGNRRFRPSCCSPNRCRTFRPCVAHYAETVVLPTGSHSQDSVEVNVPLGSNALGFTSASETHFQNEVGVLGMLDRASGREAVPVLRQQWQRKQRRPKEWKLKVCSFDLLRKRSRKPG